MKMLTTVTTSMVAWALAAIVGSSGCFLRVSSGIVAGIPPGATAVGRPLAGDDVVVAGWDGSFSQDGSLLVLVTEERLIRHDEQGERVIPLIDIVQIIVDEDEGQVVVTTTGDRLALPIGSSNERLGFAKALQQAVQQRKLQR
jgi:hypothetical protein